MVRPRTVLIVLGLAYCAVCIALFLSQDSIVFHPSESDKRITVPFEEYEILLDDAKGISSRGYIVNRNATGPVVVFFTGNLGEARGYVRQFHVYGAAAVLTNYRGFGKSDGQPSEKVILEDAKLLVDWTKSEFPDRPLVLMGNSLGCGVAILTSDPSVEGLILASPFRSLVHAGNETPSRILPLRFLLRHKFDVRSQLNSLPRKILVLYSEHDYVIPPKETRKVLEQLPQAEVVIAEGPHEELLWRFDTREAIKHWLAAQFPD
ncbi:MAG: alpha/beta hydrolase [Gammaproteobacteria bacterium]|nr:alpha/beta hydrolase [Gammaproteobacteria bacterium]